MKDVLYDRLPEQTRYRDEGCELHPTCLGCPLPQCRYDDPGGRQFGPRRHRDREVRRLHDQGLSVFEIAHRFGISVRTVYRIVRREPHG